MNIRQLVTLLKQENFHDMLILGRDWQAVVRFYFLYAAIESGLIGALDHPASRAELTEELSVQRPEILDTLLQIGMASGELTCQDGRYAIKGKRSRALLKNENDPLAALVQASVGYYNDVYRNASDQLHGTMKLSLLDEIGDLVARVSRISEPYQRAFVIELIKKRSPRRILEVGCGSGVYLRCAAEGSADMSGIGLEIDEAVVNQARKNLQLWGLSDRFQIVYGDINRPPADITGNFDLVTLYNNIYYFSEEDRPSLFLSLRKFMTPGGFLAITSSFQSKGKDLSSAHLNLATSSMMGCTPLPEVNTLTGQLQQSGFSQIAIEKLMPGSEMYAIVAS